MLHLNIGGGLPAVDLDNVYDRTFTIEKLSLNDDFRVIVQYCSNIDSKVRSCPRIATQYSTSASGWVGSVVTVLKNLATYGWEVLTFL